MKKFVFLGIWLRKSTLFLISIHLGLMVAVTGMLGLTLVTDAAGLRGVDVGRIAFFGVKFTTLLSAAAIYLYLDKKSTSDSFKLPPCFLLFAKPKRVFVLMSLVATLLFMWGLHQAHRTYADILYKVVLVWHDSVAPVSP